MGVHVRLLNNLWYESIVFSDIFDDIKIFKYGVVAQVVEQWTENPCVGGSTPPHTTLKTNDLVAQLVEHGTFNAGVKGSSPFGVTN